MDSWIKDKLIECLAFEVPDEWINDIKKIENEENLKKYCECLLNFKNESHIIFYNALKQRLFPSNHVNLMTLNNKAGDNEERKSTGAKRKTKYYNFYGKDGKMNDVAMLKGRIKCDCQASKHKLIANCLNCGRIVCEQEGSGSCLFCGNLVCTEEEMKLINSQTKKGDNHKKSLMNSKGLNDALAQRDRLLEYDKNSERRTTVIDDESDYFKANSVWLSEEERKKLKVLEDELREHKHASRLNKKVTLDFAGRQVIEEQQLTKEIEEKILRQIMDTTSNNNYMSNVNPDIDMAPIFDENIPSNFPKLRKKNGNGFDGVFSRVQDKEFQEMSDLKGCLSMHQPWASLLVAGIKQHEGRSWYHSHRGRLWIASTAKQPDPDEIKNLENFYRTHYKNPNIEFPSQYPSAVLLGCVNVTDCLPQEEYRKVHPEGESESPFVFICDNPQELPIRFPIKGQHKIYKLDPNIHSAALKTLMKCQTK